MSDEQRKGEEAEVDAHVDDVRVIDEPAEDDEVEVEAHIRFSNARME